MRGEVVPESEALRAFTLFEPKQGEADSGLPLKEFLSNSYLIQKHPSTSVSAKRIRERANDLS